MSIASSVPAELRRDMRKYERTQSREPCRVCGKHIAITEAHHLLKLKDICEAYQYNPYADIFFTSLVWLCPNCHTYVHFIERDIKNLDKCEASDAVKQGLVDIHNARIEWLHYVYKDDYYKVFDENGTRVKK